VEHCVELLPALLEELVERTADRAVAADVAAEAVATVLAGAGGDGPPPLRAAALDVLRRAERRGAVPDAARRRMGMPPLDLAGRALAALPEPPRQRVTRPLLLGAGGPESHDFAADLTAQMRAARRRPTRRVTTALAVAALVAAALVGAVALAAGGGGADPASPAAASCPQRISPELARRVPALDAARIIPLPAVAGAVLEQRSWPVDRVQDGQARLVGIDGDVRFWAVPVVAHGDACAPADGACVIAAAPDGRGDAHCAWGDPLPSQRVSEQPGMETVIGFADPEALVVRVRIGGRWTLVPTAGGVVATLLPLFPGEASAPETLPRVAVVDATGSDGEAVDRLVARLRDWGYRPEPHGMTHDPPSAAPEVRWRERLTDRATARRLARRLGARTVRRVAGGSLDDAPLTVVAAVG
jgi:hypothetical protein